MTTTAPPATSTPYDRVPYTSRPFRQAHPDRLATVARLFGLDAAEPGRGRVLEIGCASGGHLVPMAEQFPGGTFLGIDASARQIDEGRETVDALGLTNVELRHGDVRDFNCEAGEFDFVVCHGVYSWVPDDVRRAILGVLRHGLAGRGVGYVSYNTYPGWHMRGMIRDVMRYRANAFEEPATRLAQARGLLAFLTNSVRGEDDPYAMLLRRELESVGRSDDSYLLHEHLEEVNEPLYFHEFAGRLGETGLRYLGEADYGTMSPDNFPEPVAGMLRSVSRDRIETEQYMDFLRNRAFRQTLICRDEAAVEETADPRRLAGLRVASPAKPDPDAPVGERKVGGREETVYRRGSSRLRTTDPVVRAAFARLREAWPASVPFLELAAAARSEATGRPAAVDAAVMSGPTARLAATLLRCFATSVVDLHAAPAEFVTKVSGRPVAPPLARRQAERGSAVTNRLHQTVELDDLQRQVLRTLDGEHDADGIVHDLAERVGRAELVLHRSGGPVADGDVREVLEGQVPAVLESLARRALLIA